MDNEQTPKTVNVTKSGAKMTNSDLSGFRIEGFPRIEQLSLSVFFTSDGIECFSLTEIGEGILGVDKQKAERYIIRLLESWKTLETMQKNPKKFCPYPLDAQILNCQTNEGQHLLMATITTLIFFLFDLEKNQSRVLQDLELIENFPALDGLVTPNG